jgi:predicted ATPase
MIIRAEISNYKSISTADLSFSKENVVVGQNGVGKSNLLDAFHFIRDAVWDGLDHAITKRHGIVSIRRWSKTRPYNISIKLCIKNQIGSGEYRITLASGGGDFSVIEEEATWWGRHPFRAQNEQEQELSRFHFLRSSKGDVDFNIEDNPFEPNSRPPTVPPSELLLTQFAQRSFGPFSFFFQDLHQELSSFGAYSIYPNKIREPQAISNSEVLADDGSNLASIIRQMRSTTHRSSREYLTTALRQVLPILTEIRIESAGGFYVPVFRVTEEGTGQGHDLNMSQISDGTLRMLGMLTAFYQPKAPTKIAIEEPEQMIHPGLLAVLVDAARDYLDNERIPRQFFTTTHSPNLLDIFEPSSIIGASFENGVSKFSRLSERQMKILRDGLYTSGELLVAEGIVA